MKRLIWLVLGAGAFAAGFVFETRRQAAAESADFGSDEEFETYSVDTTGDGRPDTFVAEDTISADTTGDGSVDTIQNVTSVGSDTTGDGRVNTVETTITTATDTTGDGEADEFDVERHVEDVPESSNEEPQPSDD